MGFFSDLFGINPAPATSGKCGINVRRSLSNGTLTISGTGTMEISDGIILAPWYKSRDSIKKVIICSGVTTICHNAFSFCENLTSVKIPTGVTSIGYNAFSFCKSLTSVKIPTGVTSIGESAFQSCSSLAEITLPESITSIDRWAFRYCMSLTSITIPAGVTSIGDFTFEDCTRLKEIHYPAGRGFGGNLSDRNNAKLIPYNVTQPTTQTLKAPKLKSNDVRYGTCGQNLRWELTGDTLTISGTGKMNDYDVRDNPAPWDSFVKSIRHVVIADGVTTIGDWAFSLRMSLTSVTIPDSVTTIGVAAFAGCENLTSVTIPDSVTTIGNLAFYECTSLTGMTIPDSVTMIGYRAFGLCKSLTRVTISDSVTIIDDEAFKDCTSLKEIHYPAGRGFEENLSQGNNAKLIPYNVTQPTAQTVKKPKFPVIQSSPPQPTTQTGKCGKNLRWKLNGDTLTISGTGEMENYDETFFDDYAPWNSYLESIRYVVIADEVTTIGDWAFNWCESLESVIIGNSVTTIGKRTFNRCENLTSVAIGNSVKTIGDGAFRMCQCLTSVTIPHSVTIIGDLAFRGCYSLTSITIPDSVTTIGKEAFDDCKNLKEIHYPAGRGFEENLSKGNNAKLIPYTVTQPTAQTVKAPKFPVIQSSPPQKKIHPAQSTTKLVAEKLTWSFEGKTLTVGGVREIKNFPYAQIPWIDHLHDIQRIIIGNGVKKISAHAFDECPRLEILELPASVKTIGDMAFSVCFCGSISSRKNVFWSLEDGVLVLKKNPDMPPAADFSTGAVSWIFAEKNIRSVKLEDGVKPTEKFFSWLAQRYDGKEISLK